ncbi:hypothetical protein E2562_014094 [Oryza meyeriana var. granulata]|uniref:Uncharacterized protein n=1 Tax=Oryza meyeriana var. granulata TaxID=110450 RepID=A0A6G1DIS9_9ORYZ|nr:hypothetical protein E2562_014094 [Oryza meyeriana var. granulata]
MWELLTDNDPGKVAAKNPPETKDGGGGEVVAADDAPAANGEVPAADDGEAVATDEAPAPNAQASGDDGGSAAAAGGSRSPCLTTVGRMLKVVVVAGLVAFFYSVVTAPTTF